jgi:hypothetical protein
VPGSGRARAGSRGTVPLPAPSLVTGDPGRGRRGRGAGLPAVRPQARPPKVLTRGGGIGAATELACVSAVLPSAGEPEQRSCKPCVRQWRTGFPGCRSGGLCADITRLTGLTRQPTNLH